MDKQTFFDNLHYKLGNSHNLTSDQVATMRCMFLGNKKTRKEIAEWAAIKLAQDKRNGHQSHINRRSKSKNYYQTILNFVASCSKEEWEDIVQKTSYDI